MTHSQRWRFGPFEADLQEHQLCRHGQPVPVTRKSFSVLAALLARPGKLLSKAELFSTVWAGTVVTDAALSRAIHELRLVLGDDANAPTYIATAHGLGFRFIAPLHADSDASDAAPAQASAPAQLASDGPAAGAAQAAAPSTTAATATAARQSSTVVSRDTELDRLARALGDARAGRRQLVFVTGEAGIGKTSLVDAFLGRAAGLVDVCVAQGRCIEQYGTGEAYLPILEALESVARQVGPDVLRAHLLRYAPAWLAQLPWLAHDTDPAALQRALAGATAQRMLREIAQALEVLAAERPLVLWLEDLHWSDYASLDVIAFLGGRREPARLLVIGSFRPGDALGRDSPLPDLVQRLTQRGQAQELALGLLDAAAIARYLHARLPPAPGFSTVELAAFIHRRTEGHALFTVAVVDDLVRQRQLIEGAQGWRLAGAVNELGTALPESLRQLVQRQVEQLADGDRQIVEAAAVAGPEFSAAAVAAALELDTAQVEESCLRLARAGRFMQARAPVAWPDGSEAACFGFVHALYWQGSYEHISPARRARWQQRIAEREELAWGTQCGLIATELAMRFEVGRDFERSLKYLQIAGASALARCAYVEAVGLLRHALGLVGRAPAPAQARLELDLLLPLGAALMAVQGYASSDVETTYLRTLALCRQCAKPGELERALRGLWNVALVRANLDQARVSADELIVHSSASGNLSAAFDAFAKLGQTSMHRGEFAAARAHLEHALSLPISADDPARVREAPRVAAYLAWVLWYTGYPTQALARAQEATALARRANNPHSSAFLLGFVGWLHAFRGETTLMLEAAVQQQVLADEHGLIYWRVWSDALQGLAQARGGNHNRSNDHTDHNDSEAGCARLRQAMEDLNKMGALVGVSHFVCELAEAELKAGRLTQARHALARSVDLLACTGNAYHAADTWRLQGLLARAGGDASAAQNHFEAAMALAQRQGTRSLELRAATSLASLWVDAGRHAEAKALLAPLHSSFDEGLETEDLMRSAALLSVVAARSG